jgi:hypothetical protein
VGGIHRVVAGADDQGRYLDQFEVIGPLPRGEFGVGAYP